MRRPPPKLSSAALALVAAVALGACGSSHTRVTHGDNTGAGGVNASYLDLGNLQYQIQLSRQLNPTDPEDAGYLTGIPAGQGLQSDQFWLGVFLLVQNNSSHPGVPAGTSDFTLYDTQGNAYHPLVLGPTNAYAYRPQTIAAKNQLPIVGSTAYQSPTQAALLLFKLPLSAYDNRPLVLRISNPAVTAQTASVILDV